MPEFAFKTIRDLSTGLRRKDFSPVELLDDVIAHYEKIEPDLNMFAFVDFEGAYKQAKASEARILQGKRYGDLDGIPTSIKDLIAVKDMPQRFGSRTVSDALMPADAPSVERLRAAGAVILGKSTTSEFGCKAVGDSPLTGVTRNPLNPNFTPGGSSAGAAAMVAAGLVPYAIGTDGGGSIRIPAALSGIFGIKAQFGRIAVYPTSATPTLAHVGPLSRTAEDAAIVLNTLAGFDSRDPFSLKTAIPDFVGGAVVKRRMRIAWSPTLGYGRVDPQVAALTQKAVERIAEMGFIVEQVDHVFDDPIELWVAEFYAGVGTRLRETILQKADLIDQSVLTVLQAALGQDMQAYYKTVFERYAFREKVRQFFEQYDVLLTPTLPVAGVPVGMDVPPGYEDKNIVSWATFTYPFNLTGNPGASIPVGITKEGLPVGLQAISAAYDEVSILSLAHELESCEAS
jgi:aspartyl-tRNA(Asn)/glutamyl-tRNA(Gln) amidotransferase subunit A